MVCRLQRAFSCDSVRPRRWRNSMPTAKSSKYDLVAVTLMGGSSPRHPPRPPPDEVCAAKHDGNFAGLPPAGCLPFDDAIVRLRLDGRRDTTTDDANRVSPEITVLGNRNASAPRNGPPDSDKSATDMPSTMLKTKNGLTTRSGYPRCRA